MYDKLLLLPLFQGLCKEELLKKIDAGLKEVKLYKEGKLELKTLEEALNEL